MRATAASLVFGLLVCGACDSSTKSAATTASDAPASSTTIRGIELTDFRSCFHGEFWGFTADDSIAVVLWVETAGAATIKLPDPNGLVTVEIRHGAHLSEEPVCMGTGISATDRYRLDSTYPADGYSGEVTIGRDHCPTDGSVVIEHLVDSDGNRFASPLFLFSTSLLGCTPD